MSDNNKISTDLQLKELLNKCYENKDGSLDRSQLYFILRHIYNKDILKSDVLDLINSNKDKIQNTVGHLLKDFNENEVNILKIKDCFNNNKEDNVALNTGVLFLKLNKRQNKIIFFYVFIFNFFNR